jgi:hypothetical protein
MLFSVDKFVEKTGLPKTKVEHWFRYDHSGFSYPSAEDWKKVGTYIFPELLEVFDEPDVVKSSFKRMRNRRTTWEIPDEDWVDDAFATVLHDLLANKRATWSIQPASFSGSHFAVFPEELVRIPIKATCPKEVCRKCGRPREPIVTTKKIGKTEEYTGQAKKDYDGAKAQNPSDTKRRILESMTKVVDTIEYTDCGCDAGFNRGIVLDPFFGRGTTGKVAHILGRDFIGMELGEEYVEIAKKFINKRKRLDQFV